MFLQKHQKRLKSELKENKKFVNTRTQTISSTINTCTDDEQDQKMLEAFIKAEPDSILEKPTFPATRDINREHDPSSKSIRQCYIPSMSIQCLHRKELQHIVDEVDGVIVTVEEASDNFTDRSFLNIVFTPVKAEKASDKPISYIADQVIL